VSTRGHLFSFLLCASAIGSAVDARGDAPSSAKTASLSWLRGSGAEQCPTTQALAAAIEEKLGKAVFVPPANADLSVEGQVQAKKKELVASIVIRDRKGDKIGVREFHSPDLSCSELGNVLPLAIALMIDPDAEERKPAEAKAAPTPEPKAPPEPELATLAPLPKQPEMKPVATSTLTAESNVSAAIAVGALPSPAFGLVVNGFLTPAGWGVGLIGGVVGFLPERVQFDAARSMRLVTGWLYGGVCPLGFLRKAFHLWGCIEGDLGILHATTQSGLAEGSKTSPFIGLGVEAFATWVFAPPLTLRASISTTGTIFRSKQVATIGVAQTGFDPLPVYVIGNLGLGLYFE
jgi:hypothetical protein